MIICIKMDLALKNLQGLICHKNPTHQSLALSSLQGLIYHKTQQTKLENILSLKKKEKALLQNLTKFSNDQI